MAVQISGNDITVPRDGSFTRNVTIGGTLTYEDVTNIDSVGLVTARTGIEIGARPGVGASISVDGNMIVSGISTFNSRVLLGTTTEGASGADQLTVASSSHGGITIRSGSTSNGNLMFSDGTSGAAEYAGYVQYEHDNNKLNIGVNGSTKLRIDSSGRLLLGTTTEGEGDADDLTIATSGNTGITLRSGTSNDGAIFFSDGTSGTDEYKGTIQYLHSSDAFIFKTAASERVRIDSSGRLLIGKTSTSQSYPLQVQSDSNANGIVIYGRSADDIAEIAYYENDGTTKLGELQYRQDHIAFRHRVGHIEFATTYSGDSVSERMRIYEDKLLIGMTGGSGLGSSRRLQVRGTTHSNNGINILSTHNDDNPAVIDIGKSRSSGNAILGNNDDVGQINFYGNDGSGFHSMARIMCRCSGNDTGSDDLPSILEFSTLTDNSTSLAVRQKIDQNGTTTFTQTNSSQDGAGVFFVRPNAATNVQVTMLKFECGGQGRGKIVSGSSDGSAPQLASGSDYRMKENIRDYTQGYDNIKAIPVKLFDMITDGAKDIKGWVAHEVQSHIPEAVIGDKDAVVTQAMVDSGEREASELGNDIMQNLSYSAFMPDVVGALQTAITKIETLEAEVAALKSN